MCTLGSLTLDLKRRQIHISSKFKETENLVIYFPDYGECNKVDDESDAICVSFQQQMTLMIKRTVSQLDIECFEITWRPGLLEQCPTDTVKLNGHWYGGTEMLYQRWPVELQYAKMQPYISSDLLVTRDYYKALYGSVIEKYWVSSLGFGLKVNENVPLLVSFNEEGEKCMVLKSMALHPRYMAQSSELVYSFYVGDNVKHVHQYMYKMHFEVPKSIPDLRMFTDPIWSTWARYKTLVNQRNVLEYAQEILNHGLPNSQIEIDDMYSSFYGEIDFDQDKFPNAKEMVAKLHEQGFRVTVWVHPFVNEEAPCFKEGVQKRYFVSKEDSSNNSYIPSLVKWWQGTAGLIDMTNPSAVEWYITRLEHLKKEIGIDSFKFDAGEIVYFPIGSKTMKTLQNISEFTTAYAEVVSKFGGMVELRAATKSQRHGIFVRMMDKDSLWGYDNGLKTMIPTALIMGLLGYPFILPDMIGGNAYGEKTTDTVLPEKELYIRWMQLSAFLPSMQFSIAPWQYDDETVDIARKTIRMHKDVAMPVIEEAANEAVENGTPVVRPLWWMDPYDPVALELDSEFLLGESILVAPILEPGARSRDIYLPKGEWKDSGGNVFKGPEWVKGYQAGLDCIPHFIRKT